MLLILPKIDIRSKIGDFKKKKNKKLKKKKKIEDEKQQKELFYRD